MATIEDKVVKLIEVAELHKVMEPQVFKEPKKMIVWNNDDPKICKALEILPNGNIICEGHIWYNHGAFIPEKPAPRRATNRELAKWLAQGNGQWKTDDPRYAYVEYHYRIDDDDRPVAADKQIRKFDDTEWHDPTVDYMGIEEKETEA